MAAWMSWPRMNFRVEQPDGVLLLKMFRLRLRIELLYLTAENR